MIIEFINAILLPWVMLQEDSQWNGITCKKKGQKWGIEQKSSYKRNDHMNWNQESYRRNDHMSWNQESYKSTDHMNWNQESSDIHTAEKKTPAINPIDFNKLTPYTSMPKVCFFRSSIVLVCVDFSFFPSHHQ